MLLRRMMALLLVALAILPAVMLASPAPVAAQSAEDEQAFDSYLSTIDSMAPSAGPINGALELASSGANSASLGVDLADFALHVDFAVPATQSGETWAASVAFRQSGSAFHYLLLWSDGGWSFAPANGGPVSTGTGVTVPAVGELLHLHIVAVADKAYVGIGKQYLTTLDLSALLESGDITVRANLLGRASAGATLDFEGFAAWDLTGVTPVSEAPAADPALQQTATAAAAVVQTPEPTATEVATAIAGTLPADVPGDDEATFNSYVAEALSRPILYGPGNGTIAHQPDAVSFYETGVTAADFIARVECVAGQSSAEGYWDCGFVFRGGGTDHYRVAYVSDGYWFLSQGANQPLQSGVDGPPSPAADSKVVLNLIAVGDTGYFGLNDQYIATLDLSAVQEAGYIDLASAFFADTFIENGGVAFEDLIVWSLDEGGVAAPSPTVGLEQLSPTAEAGTTAIVEQTPVATTSDLPGVEGNTFTSPTFGFSQSWSDAWTVSSASSSPTLDILELESGVVQADLIGEQWDLAGGSCFDRLIQYYENEPGYSDVRGAVDNVSVVPGVWETTGILTMTQTPDSGDPITYVNYAACSVLPGQNGIASLEQFVPIGDFAAQVAIMDELRASFSLTGQGSSVPVATETPVVSGPEPTPTSGFDVPTPTPVTGVVAPTETAASGQPGGNVVGNTYTSPTFGYSLTWDDSWSVTADESSEGIDFLRISSGILIADLYAATSVNSPLACVEELFNYYVNDELYSNVVYATGADGQPLLQDFGTYATGVISFTRLLDSGATIDQFSEATCHRMDEPGAVVVMEIYMSPADFVLQRSAISALQAGLVIPGQPAIATTEVPQTPIAQPTAEGSGTVVAPPEGGSESATFFLQPVNNSGVTGTGTLEAQTRLVIVTAIVIGAQAGDTVTIQRGSCSTISGGTEPDYIVGELDETGLLREELRVRLAALTGGEAYSVVVYAGGEDFSQAIACGDIS
ncbi:MAG: hypothetical protein IT335_00725 [Thermomicrobiales bacterium]|nr:hypothetical protein [Thermomicrobiales bacterium]